MKVSDPVEYELNQRESNFNPFWYSFQPHSWKIFEILKTRQVCGQTSSGSKNPIKVWIKKTA